jgi:dUTPase
LSIRETEGEKRCETMGIFNAHKDSTDVTFQDLNVQSSTSEKCSPGCCDMSATSPASPCNDTMNQFMFVLKELKNLRANVVAQDSPPSPSVTSEDDESCATIDSDGETSDCDIKTLDGVIKMFFKKITPRDIPSPKSWWEETNKIVDPVQYTVRVFSKYGRTENELRGNIEYVCECHPSIDMEKILGSPIWKSSPLVSLIRDPADHPPGFLVWKGSALVDLMYILISNPMVPASLYSDARSILQSLANGTTGYKLNIPEAIAPCRGKPTDAGFDLNLVKLLKSENGVDYYTTGVILEPPPLMWYMLVGRSSMAKSGYVLANGVGIIDQSYRGEVIVALRKVNADAPDIELPARWVQVVPQQWFSTQMVPVDDVSNTVRGDSGGLGSKQFTH